MHKLFSAHIANVLQSLARALFDPYRPELHYMRGPGPKWHAKHETDARRVQGGTAGRLNPLRFQRLALCPPLAR